MNYAEELSKRLAELNVSIEPPLEGEYSLSSPSSTDLHQLHVEWIIDESEPEVLKRILALAGSIKHRAKSVKFLPLHIPKAKQKLEAEIQVHGDIVARTMKYYDGIYPGYVDEKTGDFICNPYFDKEVMRLDVLYQHIA